MNVSELKIDNFIQLYRKAEDAEKTVYQIKSIYFEDEILEYCVELNDRFIVNVKTGISPIEITPEWLFKFGFKVVEGQYYLLNLRFTNYRDGIYNVAMIHNVNDFNNKILTRIKYVHQLQNIYSALTGEKLKLRT